MLKKLALTIPAINRLWSDRRNLTLERDFLKAELQKKNQLTGEGGKDGAIAPQSPFFHYYSAFDPIELMHKYWKKDVISSPEHLTNFLGVKISPHFLPSILSGKKGQIENIPIPANWHADIAEWGGALRAVDLSGTKFRVVELGCGWGCWLLNTGCAARSTGREVDLIGIEGDEDHLHFAQQGLKDNGFEETDYSLIHGIAAPRKGTALFPIVGNASEVWGSEPIFDASEDQVLKAAKHKTHHVLKTYPIDDIAGGEPIDLLHIDIQGGEADFVDGCLQDLSSSVRYMVIGTHSRQIEGRIMTTLLANGWSLEIERPAIITIVGGAPQIAVDGVQGWRNTRI